MNNKIISLAFALKLKTRMAGELVRLQHILQRENARRNDNSSTVDREAVWNKVVETSEALGILKTKITQANIGIYPMLERMAELKSRISFLISLNKREDAEVQFVGRDQEKLTYIWDSYITQPKCDEMVVQLQQEINDLQDKVDIYNASTEI